jgi:predicted membrane-bound dolichyl-phosphate-mannose-protein mannosyltransferase
MKFRSLKYILLFLYLALLLVHINTIPTVIGDENTYTVSVFSLIEGKIDTNNHPLLAKTVWLFFLSLGNLVFGSSAPLFWRLGTIIFSVGSLMMFYKVARIYFSEKVALIAAVFLSIDPMYFVFSRLVQLDIPALFFVLLSFYFILKYDEEKRIGPLFISALALGLSLATKMLSLGVVLLVFLYLLAMKKQKKRDFLNNLVNSILYGMTVICGFILGNVVFLFKDTGGVNFLRYTLDLIQSQTYVGVGGGAYQNSPIWSWFTIPQIISLYRLNLGDRVESIIAFQNPVFFALTLVAFFYAVYKVLQAFRKERKMALVLMYFLGLNFLWLTGLHGTYYYYIIPLLPFIILMNISFILAIFKNWRHILNILLIFSVLVFVFTYPLLIGMNVPKNYDLSVYKYNQLKYPNINTLFCQNCYPRK